MNAKFNFNAEYLEECAKRRKKPEERKYPKKDWPEGYEPTEKEFEEWIEEKTGVPASFHWEDIGGGRKRGVFTPLPIKKNAEILNEIEKQKNELIEENVNDDKKQIDNAENSSNRCFIDNGESLNNSVEKVDKNKVIPKNEAEKKQVVKLNKEAKEAEKAENKQAGETNLIQKKETQSPPLETPQNNSYWVSKSLVWGSVGVLGLGAVVLLVKAAKKLKNK